MIIGTEIVPVPRGTKVGDAFLVHRAPNGVGKRSGSWYYRVTHLPTGLLVYYRCTRRSEALQLAHWLVSLSVDWPSVRTEADVAPDVIRLIQQKGT